MENPFRVPKPGEWVLPPQGALRDLGLRRLGRGFGGSEEHRGKSVPDINGKEVCQRVRSDNTLESVKIICISGMIEQDKVADLMAAGANAAGAWIAGAVESLTGSAIPKAPTCFPSTAE